MFLCSLWSKRLKGGELPLFIYFMKHPQCLEPTECGISGLCRALKQKNDAVQALLLFHREKRKYRTPLTRR